MLKDLLKNELRQLWLGPARASAAETSSYWEEPASRARMDGGDVRATASALGNGTSFRPSPRDVLTAARAASGM